MKAGASSNPGAGAWTNRKVVRRDRPVRQFICITLEPRGDRALEGLAMSKHSATKTFTAILSIATIGAALCLGMGTVRAEEKAKDNNVT